MESPKKVTLIDGTESTEAMVRSVMMILSLYWGSQPEIFIGLVRRARDPSFELSNKTVDTLEKNAVMKEGRIPSSVVDIIRNAVVGEGAQVKIISPLA